MAHAVKNEGRRAVHAATDATHKIFMHASGMDVPGELASESGYIEAERSRVPHQIAVVKGMLMRE